MWIYSRFRRLVAVLTMRGNPMLGFVRSFSVWLMYARSLLFIELEEGALNSQCLGSSCIPAFANPWIFHGRGIMFINFDLVSLLGSYNACFFFFDMLICFNDSQCALSDRKTTASDEWFVYARMLDDHCCVKAGRECMRYEKVSLWWLQKRLCTKMRGSWKILALWADQLHVLLWAGHDHDDIMSIAGRILHPQFASEEQLA